MQEIVANVEDITFDIEIALEQQLGAHPLPFPGMDSEFSIFFYRSSQTLRAPELDLESRSKFKLEDVDYVIPRRDLLLSQNAEQFS